MLIGSDDDAAGKLREMRDFPANRIWRSAPKNLGGTDWRDGDGPLLA
jgi:hypothetical protein